MKIGIILSFVLFLLDRYGFEELSLPQILSPLVLIFIVEIVRFYFWHLEKVDERSRNLKKDIIYDKWRKEKQRQAKLRFDRRIKK